MGEIVLMGVREEESAVLEDVRRHPADGHKLRQAPHLCSGPVRGGYTGHIVTGPRRLKGVPKKMKKKKEK